MFCVFCPILQSLIASILFLSGASDVSDLPESEYERYEALSRHPISINSCTRGALRASGLLSDFQVESLLDYISRTGAVVSEHELALVDGFNEDLAHHLMPFISLEDARAQSFSHSGEATTGVTAKLQAGEFTWTEMAKTSADINTRVGDFSVAVAYRRGNEPGWSIGYTWPGGSRRKVKLSSVVAGWFNARFGQGLAQWSGTAMDMGTTPASLMKNASGTTAYKGWSPGSSMLGAAFSLDIDRWNINPFADIKAANYGATVAWNHRNGHIGATVRIGRQGYATALDFQHTVKGIVSYGEVCYDGSFNALAGVRVTSGNNDGAVRLRTDLQKSSVAAAYAFADSKGGHKVQASASGAYQRAAAGKAASLKIKAAARYNFQPEESWFSCETRSSVTYNVAPASIRVDLRQEVKYAHGMWEAVLRLDGALAGQTSGMASVHLACNASRIKAHLQAAVFVVDKWDARLYLYQYDAPGGFSVPAMYGRGYYINGYLRGNVAKWMDVYLRLTYSSYPWMETRKHASCQARLQLSFKW